MDGGVEGPCLTKAKINVFRMIGGHSHSDCMDHCTKLGGRSPSVRTESDWKNLIRETKAASPDPSRLPTWMWLSATEGNFRDELDQHRRWPEQVEAMEGVWRDYYTGEQLENYKRPWYRRFGKTHSCISFSRRYAETRSWKEETCASDFHEMGCPCSFETPPIIHVRGFCSKTLLDTWVLKGS